MTPDSSTSSRPLITSDRVKGTAVVTADGEKIGRIEEIAIDKQSGAIAYAILGEGGLLGMGEHYRPLAWGDLTYDTEKKAFALPMTKAEVEAITPLPADDLSGWTTEKAAVFI